MGSGLVSLIEAMAVELAPTRVNEVAPSLIVESTVADRFFKSAEEREGWRLKVEQTSPARRAVTLEDAARQVVGLITDPAITGSVRVVDGGQSLM